MNTTVKFSRIKKLRCCICGQDAKGRQWWNRDNGYGICGRCAVEEAATLSNREMIQSYGKVNIHYYLNKEGVNYGTQEKGN